jgi:3-oxoadipate enol-lactonase
VPDVLAVLDHFGVQRTVVVGQSLGGMVGLRLALQQPDRVAAFVACDSPLGVDHPPSCRRWNAAHAPPPR